MGKRGGVVPRCADVRMGAPPTGVRVLPCNTCIFFECLNSLESAGSRVTRTPARRDPCARVDKPPVAPIPGVSGGVLQAEERDGLRGRRPLHGLPVRPALGARCGKG